MRLVFQIRLSKLTLKVNTVNSAMHRLFVFVRMCVDHTQHFMTLKVKEDWMLLDFISSI